MGEWLPGGGVPARLYREDSRITLDVDDAFPFGRPYPARAILASLQGQVEIEISETLSAGTQGYRHAVSYAIPGAVGQDADGSCFELRVALESLRALVEPGWEMHTFPRTPRRLFDTLSVSLPGFDLAVEPRWEALPDVDASEAFAVRHEIVTRYGIPVDIGEARANIAPFVALVDVLTSTSVPFASASARTEREGFLRELVMRTSGRSAGLPQAVVSLRVLSPDGFRRWHALWNAAREDMEQLVAAYCGTSEAYDFDGKGRGALLAIGGALERLSTKLLPKGIGGSARDMPWVERVAAIVCVSTIQLRRLADGEIKVASKIYNACKHADRYDPDPSEVRESISVLRGIAESFVLSVLMVSPSDVRLSGAAAREGDELAEVNRCRAQLCAADPLEPEQWAELCRGRIPLD